ncbi:MAG: hypothetical protein DI498_01570 [Paracoccus denitrificans]|nr:MAG: hypothetical protein DI498_01570 [Paracoccus denitrificans]PZO85855.1 MAG: hypothetical protein DI633_01570 [Paracoccus denitrificans]
MQCPVDGETMIMTERSGVEIDYCPKCRGVWLDRGELDKIVDRAAGDIGQAAQVRRDDDRDVRGDNRRDSRDHRGGDRRDDRYDRDESHDTRRADYRDERRRDRDDDDDDDRYRRKRKREHFLSDLFDF